MQYFDKYNHDFKRRLKPSYILKGNGELKIFRGPTEQKGNGLGNIFKRFFNWITPLVKKYGQPLVVNTAKTIGKEIISSASNVANDVVDGKNVLDSLNTNFENSVTTLKRKAEDSLQTSNLLDERNLE